MLKIRAKSWLEKDGRFLAGEGRARLLKLVDETGSIADAARKMGMSYRHAWGTLREMSAAAGTPVIQSTRGGREGGKTELTKTGRDILSRYEEGNSSVQTFLEGGPRHPRVAVDGILLMKGKLVAVRRLHPPFRGMLALPGGFVEYGERVEDAVVREFEEETGLRTRVERMLGVYSDPERDPRGQTISVVFILDRKGGKLKSGSDASSVELVDPEQMDEMAFDHAEIVRDFLDLRG